MIKKLTPHGNSFALVIEKPILQLLNINASTPLEVRTDGANLIVSPVLDQKRAKAFQSAMEKVNKNHDKTFRTLAK